MKTNNELVINWWNEKCSSNEPGEVTEQVKKCVQELSKVFGRMSFISGV
jgi:hypothetical protein